VPCASRAPGIAPHAAEAVRRYARAASATILG
jgi:hypothetical protein